MPKDKTYVKEIYERTEEWLQEDVGTCKAGMNDALVGLLAYTVGY
jgi:hypothetical protein